MNTDTWKSNDGGQTFTEFAIPHGDNHDLWIDPVLVIGVGAADPSQAQDDI